MKHSTDISIMQLVDDYFPLVAFFVIYVPTCLIGALLFFADYKPFVLLYEYYSGVIVPNLSVGEEGIFLGLLLGAPVILVCGYLLGVIIFNGLSRFEFLSIRGRAFTPKFIACIFLATIFSIASILVILHLLEIGSILHATIVCVVVLLVFAAVYLHRFTSGRVDYVNVQTQSRIFQYALIVFAITVLIALVSLATAGGLSKVSSWANYGVLMKERSQIMQHLGFISFVNIYTCVPLAAIMLLSVPVKRTPVILLVKLLALLIVGGMFIFIFQKKPLVTYLLMIVIALYFQWSALIRNWRRFVVLGASAIAIIFVIYIVFVVAPIYSMASQTTLQASPIQQHRIEQPVQQHTVTQPVQQQPIPRQKSQTGAALIHQHIRTYNIFMTAQQREEWVQKLGYELKFNSIAGHRSSILSYALLSPLTRTSISPLYYSLIFPGLHPYYGLDFGQDILGIGKMPNDNQVVFSYMSPTINGDMAAPFQFIFYSQVGVWWALLLSLLVGSGIAIVWLWLERGGVATARWGIPVRVVVVTFAIFIALDSVRNSLLASYGVVWGVCFIGAVYFFEGIYVILLRHK